MMKKNYSSLLLVAFMLLSFLHSNAQDVEASKMAAKNWLANNKVKYNLNQTDINDAVVSNAFYSKTSKINHVYLNQSYQGVKIYNAISSFGIKGNGVFNYANAFISNIEEKINTITPVITPLAAINSVAQEFSLGNVSTISLVENQANEYVFTKGQISKSDIPVELNYYLNNEDKLKLVWNLSVQALDSQNWYSVRVDAVTGEVLDMNNWILSCNFSDGDHSSHASHDTVSNFSLFKKNSSLLVDGSKYEIFALPAESPNHGPLSIVNTPANPVASPFGWHDNNGVAGAEYTITRGNNVLAQEDANGNDGTGVTYDGGSLLNFTGYNTNLDQAPLGYQSLSTTNLFYINNMMHDIWYMSGFDEASGNFQDNNYGNGGVDDDYVLADAQDGAGLNNATFGTPPDGFNPSMTMYLFSANGPPGQPLTINNTALAGDYSGLEGNFGTPLGSPITFDLALVDDNAPDTANACEPIVTDLTNKIAVIRRGGCEFGFKVLNAQNKGAAAVIVVNAELAGQPFPMGGGADGGSVTIPNIMVGQVDGTEIINALEAGQIINATLKSAGPYQKDGSLDNGIIAHEYGHGISTRLTGGASNSGCLGNAEQMGEGWSDWFGLMVTMKASDVPETGRGIGTFAVGQPVTGGGIRPFPYSTDTAINPVTYGGTNDASTFSQPHGIGSIWSAMLWDLTWKFVEKYGFDADLYNGTGGNNKVMKLVLDGLKLQPCGTGFVQGRDAILAADTATGGEDQCLIWEVFAARGLGTGASQGAANSRTDQVESFDMPVDTDPTLANCTSLSVDENKFENLYKVYPNPANNEINIAVSKNLGNAKLSLTDINGRVVLTTSAKLNGVITLDVAKYAAGIYILTIEGDKVTSNKKVILN